MKGEEKGKWMGKGGEREEGKGPPFQYFGLESPRLVSLH